MAVAAALTVAGLSHTAVAWDTETAPTAGPLGDSYRADVLEPVDGAAPESVQIVRESGAAPWTGGIREQIERRIRAEWVEDRVYGPVYSSVGLWLRYPLTTARISGRVLIPVLERDRLTLEGTLVSQESDSVRRVVILVDASESSAAPVPAGRDGDAGAEIPLLEAQMRAVEELVSHNSDAGIEYGIIAFAERTWPIVEMGAEPESARQGLARFRREHPRGQGRSDTVCALWTAADWLRRESGDADREILLLTGSDLPHSGRFFRCSGALGEAAEQECAKARNETPCPATHEFTRLDGFSDIVQLASFGRQVRGELRVTPVLFPSERNRRFYAEVARRTGSRAVRVRSARAVEELLPALVTRRIKGVFARNRRTGRESGDLLAGDGRTVVGEIPLAPGANDIELRIEGKTGIAGLFRFRVYSASRELVGVPADVAVSPE